MPNTEHTDALEERIGQWREYLRRRQAIHAVDVAELEDHLREQIASLADAGLDAEEAFLVAVKRIGALIERRKHVLIRPAPELIAILCARQVAKRGHIGHAGGLAGCHAAIGVAHMARQPVEQG